MSFPNVGSFALAAAVVAVGCSASTSGGPCQGTETCACYPNGTCETGLSCYSNLCVSLSGEDGGAPDSGAETGFILPLPEASSPDGSSHDAASRTDSAGGPLPEASTPDVSVGGPNLIADGDFSNDGYAWHSEQAGATYTVVGTQGCLTIGPSSGYGGLGWPVSVTPLNLPEGQSYTLTYTVSGTITLGSSNSIEAKVGPTAPPYVPVDGDFLDDSVSPTPTVHSHVFTVTAAGGDPAAGISLQYTGYSGDMVCFSNVSLTQN